ncbi:GGDEF domain-containing protein [Amycolatopsis palatopharyngis]|uniref:GGDEF domain-containing protein n=1 Tax=Amycolatopsis palatopharyngis TaxID=187982 RepID=UPI000E260404|nr:EAL domain-containing protein [Amycolatopsis palatopharyngis]
MESLQTVRFAFQPLYSLHTGGVVALEALARPQTGEVPELLTAALRAGKLVEVDVGLAARAVEEEARHDTLLPLHLNLTAASAAAQPGALTPLLDALSNSGRRPREVVLEIGPPFRPAGTHNLVAGLRRLTELGFRIAFDGLGAGDLALDLLTCAPADMLKLDRGLLGRLPGDPTTAAAVEALAQFASRAGLRLVATGVETREQLDAARRLGIRIAQGRLFAPARQSAVWTGTLSPATPDPDEPSSLVAATSAPKVADFLRPATTLDADATCDEVREVLAAGDAPTGIVGLDDDGRPAWSIDRSRFLLAVTGRYGHALHAKRPAARLADHPHTIHAEAGALALLDLVNDADWGRTGDDVVVVDDDGQCLGVVLVTEIVRGVAETKIEEAAALSPLTRLPGSDTIARDVDRRLSVQEALVVAWLDVDSFKAVNDSVGFAAGDDLIRELGRALTDLSTQLSRMTVSHVGGDDFLIACDMDEIATVAATLLDTSWSAEGIPVTVSLATLVCASGSIDSYREISRMLAPLKQRAKDVSGSSWVLGRPGSDRIEVLRGLANGQLVSHRSAS